MEDVEHDRGLYRVRANSALEIRLYGRQAASLHLRDPDRQSGGMREKHASDGDCGADGGRRVVAASESDFSPIARSVDLFAYPSTSTATPRYSFVWR